MGQNNFVVINAAKNEVAYAIAAMNFDEVVEIITTVDQIYAEAELTESLIFALGRELKECLDNPEMLKFKEKFIKLLSE